MAREITMQELTDWVAKNEHRTWADLVEPAWTGPGGKKHKEQTHEVKYLTFTLDTRDMKVYRLAVEGSYEDSECDAREEFDGTILDLLEKKLAENEARAQKRMEEDERKREARRKKLEANPPKLNADGTFTYGMWGQGE